MVEETSKKKKKAWIRIVGPNEFNNSEIGQSYVNEPNDILGKKLNVDLATLTGDMRKQSASVGFLVTDVSGNQAKTDMVTYSLSTAHIRRMIRAGKEKLESSFVVGIKSDKKIKVKLLILTKAKTNNSILTAIRKEIINYFTELGKISNFNEILGRLITGEIIKTLRADVKKIYPLSVLEIKSIELLK